MTHDTRDSITPPKFVDHINSDYEVGQDNVQIGGLDIHYPVFTLSAGLSLLFASLVLIYPDVSNTVLTDIRDFILQWFDTLFSISLTLFTIVVFLLLVSPFGKIRLGGEEAEKEFGFLSWSCMLFSAGVGIGMTFYGAAEPLSYYTGSFGTPLGVEAETPEAHRMALSATVFHWGLSAWSVYALIGLAIAFFGYNWRLPLTIRSIFYPILGDKIWSWPGHIIDIIAVLATLFGLATSLGLGAQQVSAGLFYLFGIQSNLQNQALIIALITCIAIFSVFRGLDKGVRILSNFNIMLAIGLLSFVILAGPTWVIFSAYGSNLLAYFQDLGSLSNWERPNDEQWYHDWTIFYWAWWISWSPFVGMFIARISKGRTIREFLTVVMFVPLLFSLIWFTSFGETAIWQHKQNLGQLTGPVENISLVLFHMLGNMVFPIVSSIFALFILVLFFVTSSDSGSLVIDSVTSGGKDDAPISQRIFWATVQGLMAIVLLVGGGSSALGALQAGAISMALPFVFIMLLSMISLLRGLYIEMYNQKNNF